MRTGLWVASGVVAFFAVTLEVILAVAWASQRNSDAEFNWLVPAAVGGIFVASAAWFIADRRKEMAAIRRSDVVDR